MAAFLFDSRRCARKDGRQHNLTLLETSSQGLPADMITYNATFSACGKDKQWQRALKLMESLKAAKAR